MWPRSSLAVICSISLTACSSMPQTMRKPTQVSSLPAAVITQLQQGAYEAAIPELESGCRHAQALACLNLGIARQQTGDWQTAVTALEQSLKLRESAQGWLHLGNSHKQLNDLPAAQKAWQKALLLDPDYALAHFNLALLHDVYLQQPAAAHRHLTSYLQSATATDQEQVWMQDLQRRASTQATR